MADFIDIPSIPNFLVDTVRDRVLSEAEERMLLEEGSEPLRPVILMALHSGMRQGEILKLDWENFDLSRRKIKVERTKSRKAKFSLSEAYGLPFRMPEEEPALSGLPSMTLEELLGRGSCRKGLILSIFRSFTGIRVFLSPEVVFTARIRPRRLRLSF